MKKKSQIITFFFNEHKEKTLRRKEKGCVPRMHDVCQCKSNPPPLALPSTLTLFSKK
jgi:hypothetical protein